MLVHVQLLLYFCLPQLVPVCVYIVQFSALLVCRLYFFQQNLYFVIYCCTIFVFQFARHIIVEHLIIQV